MTHTRLYPALLLLAGCALGFGLGVQTPVAEARPPADVDQAVARFTTGINQADAVALEAACTAALWSRLEPDLAGGPQPGELGTFTVIRAGLLDEDVAAGSAVYAHADGVRDVVTLTLVREADGWKVSGGLGGRTPDRPLSP